jgi:alpha-L-arabinofuranosidase
MNHTAFYDVFGTLKNPLWEEYENGGSVTFSTTGGDSPAGEKSYDGYAIVSRSSAGYTGLSQRLIDKVKAGESFVFSFSSFGVGQAESVIIYLFDVSAPGTPISNVVTVSSGNGSWLRQNVVLSKIGMTDVQYPGLLIVIDSPDTSSRIVHLDEMRLSKSGAAPAVKTSVKNALNDMGVKSVRWPGGTLVDFFDWKSSIGTTAQRGEIQGFADYQTPVFGLHEFLNLCEELNMEPVIQVNFLKGPAEVEDLVEYILGSDSTTWGALRKANGRTAPWNVLYFEIGNEPSKAYRGIYTEPDTAFGYSLLVKPVNEVVKNKAASLGKSIIISGIIEPSFQLADWLAAVAAMPGAAYDPVRLIYNWNSQALGTSGFGNADLIDGHFYGFREYDPAMTQEDVLKIVMAGGATLEKTMIDKIRPLSALPLILTEYHLYPEHKDTKAPQINYLHDFQSGLGIADIIISLMEIDAVGGHLYSFAHPYFGAVQNTDSARLRPAGLALKMLSPFAGEEKIGVTCDGSETVTIPAGSGNIPSGLTYPVVSVMASRNSSTGKPRIVILNRSFNSAKTLTLTFSSQVVGSADIYTYSNNNIAAENETGVNVIITANSGSFNSPFTVTVPAHSLTRIDMK